MVNYETALLNLELFTVMDIFNLFLKVYILQLPNSRKAKPSLLGSEVDNSPIPSCTRTTAYKLCNNLIG